MTTPPISYVHLQIAEDLIIILSYLIIGASLKYIDQAYDEDKYSKKRTQILAIIVGLIMGILIAFNPASTIMLSAIIIGVALTNKLDTIPHITAGAIGFAIPITIILIPQREYTLIVNWSALIFMSASGVIDEILDHIGDRRKIKLLTLRPMMKVAALILTITGTIEVPFFIAFLAFDIGYSLIGWYSKKPQKNQNINHHHRQKTVSPAI